jgi:hypothetical protein
VYVGAGALDILNSGAATGWDSARFVDSNLAALLRARPWQMQALTLQACAALVVCTEQSTAGSAERANANGADIVVSIGRDTGCGYGRLARLMLIRRQASGIRHACPAVCGPSGVTERLHRLVLD